MKGLTFYERRALTPIGPRGEYCPDHAFDSLVRDQRGRWVDPEDPKQRGREFEPTEWGLLALRVCPPE